MSSGSAATTTPYHSLSEALRLDGRWTAVRFDLALALMFVGDRSRSFLEYQRGVHQAVNGVERLRGACGWPWTTGGVARRTAGACPTREAIAARDLLRSTLRWPTTPVAIGVPRARHSSNGAA